MVQWLCRWVLDVTMSPGKIRESGGVGRGYDSVGTRLWDQMMMAGVVGDGWVMCTGHGQCDMLGNEIHEWMHRSATEAEYRSAQECSK